MSKVLASAVSRTSYLIAQASSPSPVFGSASTFGAGTGFGGFKGVGAAASSSQAEKPEDNTPPEEGTGETEEECQAEFRPIVQLEEVERVSGEEGEKTLADLCAPPPSHSSLMPPKICSRRCIPLRPGTADRYILASCESTLFSEGFFSMNHLL
jgi:hypothetical protein